jgi:hypothetical protein
MNAIGIKTLSVGAITKKIVEINPDLNVPQVLAIIGQAMEAGSLNETRAIELAQETLIGPRPGHPGLTRKAP